jgi:Uncharacterized protein conserved in bacteria (DUF2330)
MRTYRLVNWAGVMALVLAGTLDAACCYFSAKNVDIAQPAQKVFITWDPAKKIETFTVQPKFEGNALDFGMVIPTPGQPKLHEMPRDYFKHLAVYTIMKHRQFPQTKLQFPRRAGVTGLMGFGGAAGATGGAGFGGGGTFAAPPPPRKPAITIVETGVVGSLDYKIIEAGRADDLFQWLKDNKYSYAGDEATLNHYVQKKWFFTIMKIDTMQMKKNKDGSYAGEVTPTRFQFSSDQLVYPLRITQLSVKNKTEALFYVQAPHKVDLEGDMSYQYTWVPMLRAASGCTPGGLPEKSGAWLKAIQRQIPELLRRNVELGYSFMPGKRPLPNKRGHIATTMEWSRKLAEDDINMLSGTAPYCERMPNVDDGFTQADAQDPKRGMAVQMVVFNRLQRARKDRPFGYLVREAPADDIRALQQLAGHLEAGRFITKFRKIFAKDEMNNDLVLVPARLGGNEDSSEYEEILPTSPP